MHRYFSYTHPALLAGLCTLALTGCGAQDTKQTTSLTGHWHVALSPTEGSTDGQDVTHENVLLTEQDGHLIGSAEPFHLEGTRDGNQVDLVVSKLDHKGTVLQHAYMKLTLETSDSLSGIGYTPLPIDSPSQAQSMARQVNRAGLLAAQQTSTHEVYNVTGERVGELPPDTNSGSAKIETQDAADVLEDICSAIDSLASSAIGFVSDNVFRPMGGCWDDIDGGGFYAFGSEGPGSTLPAWTQTYYQPIEWAPCTSRSYSFNISYGGSSLAGQTAVEVINEDFPQYADWFAKLGFSSASDALEEAASFYDAYGDFALAAAVSTVTGSVSLYLIMPNAAIVIAAQNHPFIEAVKGELSGGARNGNFYFFAGPNVTDQFNLPRSVVPCNDVNGVVFAYLVGTANVIFD